jgi:outer membrane protein assembly factor BamD (BamD/ComL family)
VTKVNTSASTDVRRRGRFARAASVAAPLAMLLTTGCSMLERADRVNPFRVKPPPGPHDTLVLRGDRLEPEAPPVEGTPAGDLAGAHELYRRGEFHKAASVFHRIANNKKNPPHVAEEARFYEAESLRMQKKYPRAADTYNKLLNDFPSGVHREQACQRMFDIADYWLEDTREEMRRWKEAREKKSWFVLPVAWVHLDKSKPFFDEEGRALEKLEQVKYNDINGPLADKALFLAGSVKFYREDYREADHFFSQIVEQHPNSPLAPKAIELAIISKHLSTGGADYDGRKVAEARQMVDIALRSYPELANQKQDFLDRQLFGITMQQAEADFKTAEFYRRTGHPGSAYFYYEIVRRRYPGTKFYDLATERMHGLRAKLEAEHAAKRAESAKKPAAQRPTSAPVEEAAPAPRRLPEEQLPTPRELPEVQPREDLPPPRKLEGR